MCVVSLPFSCQASRKLNLDECLGLVSASVCVDACGKCAWFCCGSQVEAFLAKERAQEFLGLWDYFTCALVLFWGTGMQAGC